MLSPGLFEEHMIYEQKYVNKQTKPHLFYMF